MAMDIDEVFQTMIKDGVAAARGHGQDLRGYLEVRARLVVEGIAKLAVDRAKGDIDDEDVRFAFEEIQKSEKSALLAVQATAKAAAQDAINAMLAVASGAINKAVGIAIL